MTEGSRMPGESRGLRIGLLLELSLKLEPPEVRGSLLELLLMQNRWMIRCNIIQAIGEFL
jgi:hypothetical protein